MSTPTYVRRFIQNNARMKLWVLFRPSYSFCTRALPTVTMCRDNPFSSFLSLSFSFFPFLFSLCLPPRSPVISRAYKLKSLIIISQRSAPCAAAQSHLRWMAVSRAGKKELIESARGSRHAAAPYHTLRKHLRDTALAWYHGHVLYRSERKCKPAGRFPTRIFRHRASE